MCVCVRVYVNNPLSALWDRSISDAMLSHSIPLKVCLHIDLPRARVCVRGAFADIIKQAFISSLWDRSTSDAVAHVITFDTGNLTVQEGVCVCVCVCVCVRVSLYQPWTVGHIYR